MVGPGPCTWDNRSSPRASADGQSLLVARKQRPSRRGTFRNRCRPLDQTPIRQLSLALMMRCSVAEGGIWLGHEVAVVETMRYHSAALLPYGADGSARACSGTTIRGRSGHAIGATGKAGSGALWNGGCARAWRRSAEATLHHSRVRNSLPLRQRQATSSGPNSPRATERTKPHSKDRSKLRVANHAKRQT